MDSKKLLRITNEQKARAIELAVQGAPLKSIIDEVLLTPYQFHLCLNNDPSFKKDFDAARHEGLEHIADGLLTIADEYADVQRGRLKSENARWLLSKRKPGVYGDKLDVHLTQSIDIKDALTEARARAAIDITPAQNQLIEGHVNSSSETQLNQGLEGTDAIEFKGHPVAEKARKS